MLINVADPNCEADRADGLAEWGRNKNRGRMAKIAKKTKRSDPTDEEWNRSLR